MYSYKINNSYTVYVNWDFYNRAKILSKCNASAKTGSMHAKVNKIDVIVPLSIGTKVSSTAYGTGVVESKGTDGIFSVRFSDRLVKFMDPVPFRVGSLALE